ncbi:hypothetical protein J6590_083305 [Homalodisca vitripennis]|nr:hypothetical protein J6590_083305 [Homalodisca vitripennis]
MHRGHSFTLTNKGRERYIPGQNLNNEGHCKYDTTRRRNIQERYYFPQGLLSVIRAIARHSNTIEDSPPYAKITHCNPSLHRCVTAVNSTFATKRTDVRHLRVTASKPGEIGFQQNGALVWLIDIELFFKINFNSQLL